MGEIFGGGPINWTDEIPQGRRAELEGLANTTLESMDRTTPLTPDDVIVKLTESGQELTTSQKEFLRDYLSETLSQLE